VSTANAELLDAIPYIGALLDEEGNIVRVNRAWREFGRRNGQDPAYEAVGENYLEMTRAADEPRSQHVAAKLSALLCGDSSGFSADYPCHGPEEPRWYRVHANALEGQDSGEGAGERRAVVLHENVTAERVTRLVSESVCEPLLGALRERSEPDGTAASVPDAELFETELETVLRAAHDNGLTVEGVYASRNESPYPDWEILIDRVRKPSGEGAE